MRMKMEAYQPRTPEVVLHYRMPLLNITSFCVMEIVKCRFLSVKSVVNSFILLTKMLDKKFHGCYFLSD